MILSLNIEVFDNKLKLGLSNGELRTLQFTYSETEGIRLFRSVHIHPKVQSVNGQTYIIHVTRDNSSPSIWHAVIYEGEPVYTERSYTGHMYRNSPYETSSSCGNCDGARCDNCSLIFTSEVGYTQEILYHGKDIDKLREVEKNYYETRTKKIYDLHISAE